MNDFLTRKDAEKERLFQIFKGFSGSRVETMRGLVEEGAHLYALLHDLREELAETGPTESYQNGEHQHGRKPSAALTAYLQTEKAYAATMAKLAALLPTPAQKRTEDALDAFLRAADPGNGPSKAQRMLAEIEASVEAAEDMGDAERDIAEQIQRTRAARPDVVAATPQELQEQIQGSQH